MTHEVDFLAAPESRDLYNCITRSSLWTSWMVEFRLSAPVVVDSHLIEVLARRGSILRTDGHVRPLLDVEGMIVVDGQRMKPGRIDTIEWPAGTHYIEYPESKNGKAAKIVVHLIEPVSIAPSQPDISVDYDPDGAEPNGVVTEVAVTNRTIHQQSVLLEVLAVPVGWDAFVASDPVLTLEPRGSATCAVQIELMSTLGVRASARPIVIGARTAVATTDGSDEPYIAELSTTCEIRASVKAPSNVIAAVEKLLESADF